MKFHMKSLIGFEMKKLNIKLVFSLMKFEHMLEKQHQHWIRLKQLLQRSKALKRKEKVHQVAKV